MRDILKKIYKDKMISSFNNYDFKTFYYFIDENNQVFGISKSMMTDNELNLILSQYELLSEEDYIDLICQGISMIPEEMVVHRLTGDAPRATLIGPMWSLKKWEVLNAIDKALVDRDMINDPNVPTFEYFD